MSYFAVLREAGPGWGAGGIDEQPVEPWKLLVGADRLAVTQ